MNLVYIVMKTFLMVLHQVGKRNNKPFCDNSSMTNIFSQPLCLIMGMFCMLSTNLYCSIFIKLQVIPEFDFCIRISCHFFRLLVLNLNQMVCWTIGSLTCGLLVLWPMRYSVSIIPFTGWMMEQDWEVQLTGKTICRYLVSDVDFVH